MADVFGPDAGSIPDLPPNAIGQFRRDAQGIHGHDREANRVLLKHDRSDLKRIKHRVQRVVAPVSLKNLARFRRDVGRSGGGAYRLTPY